LLENMENMLLWSKEQMKNFKPEITPIKVDELFEIVRKYFVQDKHIQWIFDQNEPIVIHSDLNYLKVILLNLSINAQKALLNTTNPTIKWTAFRRNDALVLSIQDNGPGMSEKAAGVLLAEDIGTNGLNGFGMYIIRDLSKAIQCEIHLIRPAEGGTIFELVFKA